MRRGFAEDANARVKMRNAVEGARASEDTPTTIGRSQTRPREARAGPEDVGGAPLVQCSRRKPQHPRV